MRARLSALFLLALAATTLEGCCSSVNRDLASCSASRSALERERAHLVAQLDQATTARDSASAALNSETARLNEQLNTAHAEAQELQKRLDSSEARRLQLENSRVGILSNQLDQCRADATRTAAEFRSTLDADVKAARYTGTLEGANRVLSSIQVVGQAEKISGMVFDDYYYSFQVRVGQNSFVNFRVQTKKEESGFGSALSGIKDLAPAVLALVAE